MEAERHMREEERSAAEKRARDAGDHVPGRRGVMFAETLKTLMRVSSSYRRCHWKSASEILFPILYQHLTFASHRTWKLYTKKAIFFCFEAWRRRYGDSVLRAQASAYFCFVVKAWMTWSYKGGAKWRAKMSCCERSSMFILGHKDSNAQICILRMKSIKAPT